MKPRGNAGGRGLVGTLRKAALDLAKHGARKAGIAVSHYPPPGSFQRHLRDFLGRMEINLVLDVGGFMGDYAVELREAGYQGRIISFEPVPESFEKLRARMQQDRLWTGQPFGLSDENRGALINTYGWGAFNSLLNLREDPARVYALDPSRRSQTPIELRRLDSVLSELLEGVESPRIFLKMDTQGHDVNVVKGASGVLDQIFGLQSELPAVQIYDGMLSMADVLESYAGFGFVPIGFYPVNTIRNSEISPEFDVLFGRFEGSLDVLAQGARPSGATAGN
jgi:FkbM family methyltransferase